MSIVNRHWIGSPVAAAAALALALVACSASDSDNELHGSSGGSGNTEDSGQNKDADNGWKPLEDGGGTETSFYDTGFTGDADLDPDSSCAQVKLQAELVPLDMYFMVDVSGSMNGSNINALRDGLTNFFQDDQSAGLGAAAQMFPIVQGNKETCDVNVYATPAVPWAKLPNPNLVTWISGLKANGYTPTMPALTGSVQACHARLATEPTHKCAVVLVTDGRPEGNCPPVNQAAEEPLGNVAAEAWADGIPIFAIGFPGLGSIGEAVITTIAAKGGTEKPVIIQGGNVGQAFIDALEAIRGTALGCEYQMPKAEAGTIDPKLVKVTFKPGTASEPEDVKRVDDLAGCAGGEGWYYDDNSSPSKLIMCPGTCDRMQEDDGGEIQILLGCSSNQA